MSLQYVSDNKGQVTAVQVPIEEWRRLQHKYPELENLNPDIPDWQKELLDSRIEAIQESPQRIKPIDGLLEELDR